MAVDTAIIEFMRAAHAGHTDVGTLDQWGLTASDIDLLKSLKFKVYLIHGRILLGMPEFQAVTPTGRVVTIASRFENGDWYATNGQRYTKVTPIVGKAV